MPADASIRGAWIINAVLVLGCVWTTLNTMKEAPRVGASIERKARDLDTLLMLEQERSGFTAYRKAFDSLPMQQPPGLKTLTANAMPGVLAEIRALPPSSVGSGWDVQRVEARFNGIELGMLGNLIQSASRQRPPWRLVDWSITSGGEKPGKGSAVLLFEALGKSGSS